MNGQIVTVVNPVPQPPGRKIRMVLSTGKETCVQPANVKPAEAATVHEPPASVPLDNYIYIIH